MTRRDLLARGTAALIGGTLIGSLAGRQTATAPRYARGGAIPLRNGDSITFTWTLKQQRALHLARHRQSTLPLLVHDFDEAVRRSSA